MWRQRKWSHSTPAAPAVCTEVSALMLACRRTPVRPAARRRAHHVPAACERHIAAHVARQLHDSLADLHKGGGVEGSTFAPMIRRSWHRTHKRAGVAGQGRLCVWDCKQADTGMPCTRRKPTALPSEVSQLAHAHRGLLELGNEAVLQDCGGVGAARETACVRQVCHVSGDAAAGATLSRQSAPKPLCAARRHSAHAHSPAHCRHACMSAGSGRRREPACPRRGRPCAVGGSGAKRHTRVSAVGARAGSTMPRDEAVRPIVKPDPPQARRLRQRTDSGPRSVW